jgi:hypothetical protein
MAGMGWATGDGAVADAVRGGVAVRAGVAVAAALATDAALAAGTLGAGGSGDATATAMVASAAAALFRRFRGGTSHSKLRGQPPNREA